MEMSSLAESLPPNADGTHSVNNCAHEHTTFASNMSLIRGLSNIAFHTCASSTTCLVGSVYRGVVVIKPDAYEAMGKIIDAFIKQGFIMSRMRMLRLTQDQADAFYSRNRGDAQAAYAVCGF
jgi:hypothetical protein